MLTNRAVNHDKFQNFKGSWYDPQRPNGGMRCICKSRIVFMMTHKYNLNANMDYI